MRPTLTVSAHADCHLSPVHTKSPPPVTTTAFCCANVVALMLAGHVRLYALGKCTPQPHPGGRDTCPQPIFPWPIQGPAGKRGHCLPQFFRHRHETLTQTMQPSSPDWPPLSPQTYPPRPITTQVTHFPTQGVSGRVDPDAGAMCTKSAALAE